METKNIIIGIVMVLVIVLPLAYLSYKNKNNN